MRMLGTVRWFDEVKGFGFIAPEDGSPDCFVHISGVGGTGFRMLSEGERVEFERVESPKGPLAEQVERIDEFAREAQPPATDAPARPPHWERTASTRADAAPGADRARRRPRA